MTGVAVSRNLGATQYLPRVQTATVQRTQLHVLEHLARIPRILGLSQILALIPARTRSPEHLRLRQVRRNRHLGRGQELLHCHSTSQHRRPIPGLGLSLHQGQKHCHRSTRRRVQRQEHYHSQLCFR